MTRTVLFVAIAILCASCRTDTRLDPIQTTTPIIDTAEISVREDCLYREVDRLLQPKGISPTSLHNVAVAATRFCSEAVRSRFQRASVSALDAHNLARDDQVKTEQRAYTDGLGQRRRPPWCREVCSPPMSLHHQRHRSLPKSADTVAKVENRMTSKIWRKSISRHLYRCKAL